MIVTETRYRVRCDSCQRDIEGSATPGAFQARAQASEVYGWRHIAGKDLCPRCLSAGHRRLLADLAAARQTEGREP